MYKFEIRKLTNDFYTKYNNVDYPEILTKPDRCYDVIIFKLNFLSNCFVAVPFRSEMNHRNGYLFKFSNRSKSHQSGLDYSKILIFNKSNSHFIGAPSIVDLDEYIEFQKYENKIHNNIEKYILNYVKHMTGEISLDIREYNRKYKYSTLQYFHSELGID